MAKDSGVWFDTKAQKVVESQPEEGYQLSAPGREVRPNDQRVVDAYKNPDSEPQTVTTKSAKK